MLKSKPLATLFKPHQWGLTAQGCQTVTCPATGDLTAQMSLFTNHSALCNLLNICVSLTSLPPLHFVPDNPSYNAYYPLILFLDFFCFV